MAIIAPAIAIEISSLIPMIVGVAATVPTVAPAVAKTALIEAWTIPAVDVKADRDSLKTRAVGTSKRRGEGESLDAESYEYLLLRSMRSQKKK